MPTNVVSLSGEPVVDGREPVESVVNFAEWIVEAARSGEIVGIMCAYSFADGSTGGARRGVNSYSQIGRATAIVSDAVENMRGA